MSLPRYKWRTLSTAERQELMQRPAVRSNTRIAADVAAIIEQVRRDGDDAVRALTATLDGVALDALQVTAEEIVAARDALSDTDRNAITAAIANIQRFHKAQIPAPIRVETQPGVICERIARPIEAVGLYVPAGTAPLPSAAMMLAVPATLAGCDTRVLCSPPRKDGSLDPAIVFAAHAAGITQMFKIGGAQAIAAMAYGTATVPKVSKVFGPGNAYVTAAKMQVAADAAGAAQDMPAGPSEVLVIADAHADADFVATDLLSQAEHGADSQVILLTDSAALLESVNSAIERFLQMLDRSDLIRAALDHSALIEVPSIDDAIAISNQYAPEHLIVNTTNARTLLPKIRNAGSVFLGSLTPESLGDYCSGTNHVLPTYGYARNYSGLGIDQFLLQMTVQEATPDGFATIGPIAATLARLEGLSAHALAVDVRLAQAGQ